MATPPEPKRQVRARSFLDENIDAATLQEFEALLVRAERLLGPDALPPLDEITDFRAASAALETGWRGIRSTFADGTALAERVDATELDELMGRLVHSERTVRDAEVRHRDSAMRQVRETLRDLRDITSVDALISAGAAAVCQLGFDRSIISRVEGNTWMTEVIRIEGDSEWASEILAAGRSRPVPLVAGLPEDESRRRRRPIVVTQVQEREAVHQAVAETSMSRSYVAAPIMPAGHLLGFVHADRFFHRGDVGDFDAEVLGVFAEGYSFALERALVAEQLHELRASVQQIGLGLQGLGTDDGSGRPGPAADAVRSPGWRSAAALRRPEATVGDVELTRREHDVLELMAQGDTNLRIAHRLSVSEGTVKTHVKHILRKLGAANRAEAVARWHEARARG